ncbi:Phosphopantothenate--cysteine ligase [Arachis hypogaea]|uniref:Phosphopantothenate--cysteine ligase n=1 Tax=Arachis hypogaea TaxID=3818 RepID=A0A6B9VBZ8_ARAHY|nr:Phosphopantothenate--cysteine ligase [Arachis hypogaea]
MVAPPLHWSSGSFAMLTTLVQVIREPHPVFSEGAICCDLLVSEIPDDPLLDCFEAIEGLNIQVREVYSKAVKTAIVDHHAVVDSGLLLKLSFNTIFEYLQVSFTPL